MAPSSKEKRVGEWKRKSKSFNESSHEYKSSQPLSQYVPGVSHNKYGPSLATPGDIPMCKAPESKPQKVQVPVCSLGAPLTKQATEATSPTHLHNTSKHQEYLPVKLKSQSPPANLQHTHPRAASTSKDTSKMDTLCSSTIS